jgi:uncharacterized protein YndB with AHSA1/START domain
MTRSLSRLVFIDASIDDIWHALTDATELTRWLSLDARVEPGTGGSVWLSWGEDSGRAPITVWQPGRRLQWREGHDAGEFVVDLFLEPRLGCSAVRVVQSGFGTSPEWDEELALMRGEWGYFLKHLKWYLERHRGHARRVMTWRESVPLARPDVFRLLVGPAGLSIGDSLARLAPGDPYTTITADGQTLTGFIAMRSRESFQIGLTVTEFDKAIMFIEVEPEPHGSTASLWLSTYGLDDDRAAALHARVDRLYREALGLVEPEAAAEPAPADGPAPRATTAVNPS